MDLSDAVLEVSWALLGLSWAVLGASEALLGLTWAVLGRKWPKFGLLDLPGIGTESAGSCCEGARSLASVLEPCWCDDFGTTY